MESESSNLKSLTYPLNGLHLSPMGQLQNLGGHFALDSPAYVSPHLVQHVCSIIKRLKTLRYVFPYEYPIAHLVSNRMHSDDVFWRYGCSSSCSYFPFPNPAPLESDVVRGLDALNRISLNLSAILLYFQYTEYPGHNLFGFAFFPKQLFTIC